MLYANKTKYLQYRGKPIVIETVRLPGAPAQHESGRVTCKYITETVQLLRQQRSTAVATKATHPVATIIFRLTYFLKYGLIIIVNNINPYLKI